jgi:hypothetical protein
VSMLDSATIFHPLHGFTLCYGGYDRDAFLDAGAHPANGTLVRCRVCGRTGVLPDEGHELEFMPPGTERGPGGGFTWHPPGGG